MAVADYVAIDDRAIWTVEDKWHLITQALMDWRCSRGGSRPPPRHRGPGRPPGKAITGAVVLLEIARLHELGIRVTRPLLADTLACSVTTIKRACREAGLHGAL